MLQDFISAINNFLLPMTRNAVLTDRTREIQEENFGLETALISYLFLNKTGRLFQRICENPRCGLLFFPKRETRVFCDPQCATNVRVARSRAKKKKVSATKAGKKKNEKVVKNGK
jgi:predicted RNA-binding Zn ribbon-like protein